MPQYVAILKKDRVAVFADVQKQLGGHWTIKLRSWMEESGSPEAQHPERLSQEDRDLAGKLVREQAATDGIDGPWS